MKKTFYYESNEYTLEFRDNVSQSDFDENEYTNFIYMKKFDEVEHKTKSRCAWGWTGFMLNICLQVFLGLLLGSGLLTDIFMGFGAAFLVLSIFIGLLLSGFLSEVSEDEYQDKEQIRCDYVYTTKSGLKQLKKHKDKEKEKINKKKTEKRLSLMKFIKL